MRILTVTLFLMSVLSGRLFAAGTVVFTEDGTSFPAQWTIDGPGGSAIKNDGLGLPKPCLWMTSSVASKDINLEGYDEVFVSLNYAGAAFSDGSYPFNMDYFAGSWINLFSYARTTHDNSSFLSTGQHSLPKSATKIRLAVVAGAFHFDNIIVIADKKPGISYPGTPGYITDAVEPDTGMTIDPFTFKTILTDGDNDTFTYVRLHVLNEGVEISSSPFTMNYIEGSNATGALYTTALKFSTGTYTYYFEASDGWLTSDNLAEQKRFDVIAVAPPTPPANMSPKASDGATVTSSSVELTWASTVTDNSSITYTVLLSTGTNSYYAPGRAPSIFKTIYTGPATSVTLTSLIPGTLYNWQVEAVNSMGIKTTSPLYSFKTLAKTASVFNYPNPFNPGHQPTFIVYDVDTAQDVKIKIYSEYGSLVFEGTHSALPGSNEYRYDGKDNTGKTLYNGSYVCRIETSKGTRTCYLLIVK